MWRMDMYAILYFLPFGIHYSSCNFAFTISGNISIDNPHPPYSSGDEILFNFSFALNGDDYASALTFQFISDNLKFLPESSRPLGEQIEWFYDRANQNGSTELQDQNSNVTYTESYDPADQSIKVIFPQRGGASELFYGHVVMVVKDGIGLGKKLDCKGEISYFRGEFVTREIESEVTYSTLPVLGLDQSYPTYLRVLETTRISLTMDLPPGLTEGSLEVVMPISDTDFSPQFSVSDLVVDRQQSLPTWEVSALTSSYESPILQGVNDIAIVKPVRLTMGDVDSPGNELEFGFNARTEIFRGITNGTELWIGAGMKFGDSFLWVGETPVFLLDGHNREVFITQHIGYVSQYGHDGQMLVTLDVHFTHEENSTDHAYDVTLEMYLMPIMSSVTVIASHDVEENNHELIGNKFTLTLDRIRLDTNPVVTINVTLEATDTRFWLTDGYMILSEMFYYGGYTNSSEQVKHLSHFEFQLNKAAAKQLTFTSGSTCPCEFDVGRTDCGCCRPGGCQCGELNPTVCVDCRKPWRCRTYLPGYDKESRLNDQYVCRAYQLYRSLESGTSCYWNKNPTDWIGLPQEIGVITGKESTSGTLYGISNTGQGYVMSLDNGRSWSSVPDSVWNSAINSPDYISATLSNY